MGHEATRDWDHLQVFLRTLHRRGDSDFPAGLLEVGIESLVDDFVGGGSDVGGGDFDLFGLVDLVLLLLHLLDLGVGQDVFETSLGLLGVLTDLGVEGVILLAQVLFVSLLPLPISD